ncbi:MAG TPA: dTMP kinase [Acidimicrobiales bacterium]|nr:dTMP kinase [Acidimicrobiales bacterium]
MLGVLIAFEGGEGTGKSTQAARLAERLGATLTREPGGTAIGGRIRALVLDPANQELADRAEALLMAADRAQHVAEVIRPVLDAGGIVVTDRFAGSSLAYQSYGRGLPLEEIERLSRWATDGVWPDVVVLLSVPDAVAEARLGDERDRMEGVGDGFHQRVADGFRALAAADPERWVVLDGTGTVDEVADRVWAAVAPRLEAGAR